VFSIPTLLENRFMRQSLSACISLNVLLMKTLTIPQEVVMNKKTCGVEDINDIIENFEKHR
jgi:hypothetical protein